MTSSPSGDVELRVYIEGQEVYDQSFVALSGFDSALLEWIVIPSDIVVAGHATITADDPDIFYFEQDGLNFWIHPQASHMTAFITLTVPTTAGILTKEFYLDVFPIHWRALVDFMPIGVEDGVTTIYTYDVFNRLIGVNGVGVSGNEVDAQYTYRPDGLRINKMVNGNRTTHLWDGANIVEELDNDNNIKDVYIRGIGLIKNGQNQWFLFNARGDVVALTDSTGNVVREYRYDAFGNELNPDPDDTNPWRFTGEYLDIETGTIYLRLRHFNPRIGRFTQTDPLFRTNNSASLNIYTVRQTVNLYVYTVNNPIRFIDPWGLAIGNITLNDGSVVRGTIVNGVTFMPDGSRPPVGSIVQTASGFYMRTIQGGVRVPAPTPFGTPSFAAPNSSGSASSSGNSSRVTTVDHGSFTARSSAFQVTPSTSLTHTGGVNVGASGHVGNINFSPNNTGDIDLSAGLTAASGTISGTMNRYQFRGAVGASLVSGDISGAMNVGPLNIRVTGTARIGLEYGGHIGFQDGFDVGLSAKFFAGSIRITRRNN